MLKLALAALISPLAAAPALASGTDNPFVGRIYQAVAAAVVFLVVLVVLKKAAWGRILEGLQARENRIRSDLDRAEQAARDAEATLREHQQRLAGAGDEVRKLLEQGRADAQQLAGQIRAQTEAELDGLRRRAASDIDAAKEQALADLYAQTAALATEVAGKILQRQLNAADQQRLVDEVLAQVAEKPPN